MKVKTGLAVVAVIFGLGASSVAMSHGHERDHDRAQFHRAAWQHGDHDRKGYEKGKKTGWNDGALPPGQAKKESKEWRKEHKHEAREHHREMTRAQREAWEHRHHSHETVVHRQAKPPVNVEKKNGLKTVVEAAKANKERQKEAQHH
ncbi:MAG TPA: hypothetical protein VFU86_18505 [Terriglobales bacterium]|nr:hypothetical protein [Terriglobales bacterium]